MTYNKTIEIKELNKSELSSILEVTKKLPEFNLIYSVEKYNARLEGKQHLILLALYGSEPAGVKVGYKLKDDLFYSWIGGVLPAYRKLGIAKELVKYQENWLRANGYTKLQMKTHNRFKPMLLFAIKNGFNIIGFEPRETPLDHRIILEKTL